jgi:hypothetical protein
MKKQAAAIAAKDFVDSPKPGTPVERGEIMGADGKPLPYRVKSPEQMDGPREEPMQRLSGQASEDSKPSENGVAISPVKSKSM